MTYKTSISLTDEQEAFARRLVEAGRYSSLSAVLHQGLEMLRRDTERHEAEVEALRALIEERRKGPFIDIDTFEAENKARRDRRQQAEHDL